MLLYITRSHDSLVRGFLFATCLACVQYQTSKKRENLYNDVGDFFDKQYIYIIYYSYKSFFLLFSLFFCFYSAIRFYIDYYFYVIILVNDIRPTSCMERCFDEYPYAGVAVSVTGIITHFLINHVLCLNNT